MYVDRFQLLAINSNDLVILKQVSYKKHISHEAVFFSLFS